MAGAGCEEITGATCLGLVGRRASIVTWTDSVGRTAAGVMSLGGADAALSPCAWEIKYICYSINTEKFEVRSIHKNYIQN